MQSPLQSKRSFSPLALPLAQAASAQLMCTPPSFAVGRRKPHRSASCGMLLALLCIFCTIVPLRYGPPRVLKGPSGVLHVFLLETSGPQYRSQAHWEALFLRNMYGMFQYGHASPYGKPSFQVAVELDERSAGYGESQGAANITAALSKL